MNASHNLVARVRRNCHVFPNVDSNLIQVVVARAVSGREGFSFEKKGRRGWLKAGDDPAATARSRRQLLGHGMDEAGDSWDMANGRGTCVRA